MLDLAQFEREMTVERTKDKIYQRVQKRLWVVFQIHYLWDATQSGLCRKIQYGGKIYDGEHEPIVMEAQFIKVQTLLKQYEQKGETKIARVYLLTVLIRCGECGSVMTPTYTKQRKASGEPYYIYYYSCTKTY
jgi:DNA invertase Pin-like site-specific DNA recombinase